VWARLKFARIGRLFTHPSFEETAVAEIKKQDVQVTDSSDSRADATAIFFLLMIALSAIVFWVSNQ